MSYRSTNIIIQNSTPQALIVSGFGVLRGTWNDDQSPVNSQEILSDQAVSWQCTSDEVGSGTQGFARLNTTYGYIHLGWNRPWVGRLSVTTHFEAAILEKHFRIVPICDEESPMNPVIVFMIQNVHQPKNKTIETQPHVQQFLIESLPVETVEGRTVKVSSKR